MKRWPSFQAIGISEMIEPEAHEAGRPRIQSALRTVDILTAIAHSPSGLTAQQSAALLGLPLQTIYRLLYPLSRARIIQRDPGGRYVLGAGAHIFVDAFTRHHPSADFMPHLRALAGSTRESAHLAGWRDNVITVYATSAGWPPNEAIDLRQGPLLAAHSRAVGKLLLAFAEPNMRDEVLGKYSFEPMTSRTIADPESLLDELQLIRSQGYAVELEEFSEGVCAVAAPIGASEGYFAIGVCIPSIRFHAQFDMFLHGVRTCAETGIHGDHIVNI